MVFLDTNILLYSLQDSANEKKAAIAQGILRREDLVFSIQVFQEFYEPLVGELQGSYSRRVNIELRMVYQIYEKEKTVKVIRM